MHTRNDPLPPLPPGGLEKTEVPSTPAIKASAPVPARIVESYNLTPSHDVDEVRHITIEAGPAGYAYIEGQALGIVPPGLKADGKKQHVRLYSIASPREGEKGPNTIGICVRRLVFTHKDTGVFTKGFCSNYVCDLKPGDEVQISGPSGKRFALPKDHNTNLMLFAAGTGIAPFRAFVRHLFETNIGYKGRILLFAGARTQDELLYMNSADNSLDELTKKGGVQVIPALSRVIPNKKVYVQDKLLENGDDAKRILHEGNFAVYVCGIKGMEKGIEESFQKILGQEPEAWQEYREQLQAQGRWNLEVY